MSRRPQPRAAAGRRRASPARAGAGDSRPITSDDVLTHRGGAAAARAGKIGRNATRFALEFDGRIGIAT